MNTDDPIASAPLNEPRGDAALLDAVESYWESLQRGDSVDRKSWGELDEREAGCLRVIEAIHMAARMLHEDSQPPGEFSSVGNDVESTETLSPRRADGPARHELGSSVGDYEIKEKLGGGGQAATYKAWDDRLKRHVVLKLYHHAATDAERAVILAEGQKLARVSSAYVPQCFTVEQADGIPCLVLEYVPGRNLAEVHRSSPLSTKQALALTAHVAEGLAAVHACGLLHCDVKPGNVLVGDDGVPRLVDFGLSKSLGDPALASPSGTYAYMAPEQARGELERVGPRTDVFGLGATLYFLLTGSAPHVGKTREELLKAARRGDVVPVRERNQKLPNAVAKLCMRCLAKAPESRFDSAADLAKAIRSYQSGRDLAAALGLVAALAIIAGAVITILSLPGRKPDQASADVVRPAAPDATEPAAPHARVLEYEHYRNSGDDLTSGPLFVHGPVREEDALRVTASFPEPSYCFLFALNPPGAEQPVQLCYPESDDTEQVEPITQLNFPPDAGQGFHFTDGGGQQVFLLLRSGRPLPPFRDWLSEVGDLTDATGQITGRWYWEDGALLDGNKRQTRGDIRQLPGAESFATLCRRIESAADYVLDAVTFTIVPTVGNGP